MFVLFSNNIQVIMYSKFTNCCRYFQYWRALPNILSELLWNVSILIILLLYSLQVIYAIDYTCYCCWKLSFDMFSVSEYMICFYIKLILTFLYAIFPILCVVHAYRFQSEQHAIRHKIWRILLDSTVSRRYNVTIVFIVYFSI